jgi:hypothetical protein
LYPVKARRMMVNLFCVAGGSNERRAMILYRAVSLCLLLTLVSGCAYAQPKIKAVMADVPPVIDGDLSDACWQQAPSVTDFYFVTDGTQAAEPTTAWLCYDSKYIYLAFRCKDSQPDKIMAQQKKRGGDLGTDDWVGFDLDCYGKYTHISWFDVSASGVQVERLQTGDVSKIEWKGDWIAQTKRVPDGYTVEIAVPFSILQYDANRTSMGIAFIRRHARTEQWWWSPNVGPNTDARNFYLWEGLDLPKQATGPAMMAYTLFGAGADNSSRRAGLDMRYALTPSLASTLTVNPDFRNIEQAVDTVDFSYTERYLPDNRPFFQEGSDHFPMSNIFYTRRIEDIDAGMKLSGRYGDYGIAAMHTDQLGEEHHNLTQISRQWGSHTWMWLCGIESHTPKLNNTVGYVVMDQILAGKGESEIKASASYATAGSPSDQGRSYAASIRNRERPRRLRWQISHTIVEPDYYPYLGLVGDTNIRATDLYLSTYDELSKGRIAEWYADLDLSKADRMDGSPFSNGIGLYADIQFRDGTGASLDAGISRREAYRDRTLSGGFSWGGRDLYRNGNINLSIGRRANGAYLHWTVSQGWQISDRLSVQGGYEYVRIKDPSPEAYSARQLIASLIYDIDDERTLGGRIIAGAGTSIPFLTFRQRVRKGTDAYIIFGDPNAVSAKNAVTLKLIRAF